MDFGIARDDTMRDLTETGTGLGTPSYMSPEQILGDKLDFRSDIFSVGIVLYQMLTGRKPFQEDDSRTVMQKIRLDRYTSPRKINAAVPRPLERILARCMEKMPANRYPTTQSLIDDLQEFLHSRVPMNHNSRMVLYLRDIGFLTDDEAEEILAAAGPRGTVRRGPFDKKLVRNIALVQAVLAAAIVISGGAIQVASGRFDADGQSFASSMTGPVIPPRAGFLRVVVDPWAEVWIDGQLVVTTPTARAIPLSPGVHYLKLKNPYYREVDREVRIRPEETQRVEIELEPLHDIIEGSDGGVE
jgi:serine/threonine-protein kinase